MCICEEQTQTPPPLDAIDYRLLPSCLLLVRSPALLFISAIGEIASAYVAIAVSNRVKRMRNGDLLNN